MIYYTQSIRKKKSVKILSKLFLSRMMLNKEDATYTFLVELDRSIDNILIQSDTPIELMDVEGNNAVLSLSTCDPRDGNFVLATYRCQVIFVIFKKLPFKQISLLVLI